MNQGTQYGAYHQNIEDVLIAYQMRILDAHSDDNVSRVLIDRMGMIVSAYPQVKQDRTWADRWNQLEEQETPVRNARRFELLQEAVIGKGILARLTLPVSQQPYRNGNGSHVEEATHE